MAPTDGSSAVPPPPPPPAAARQRSPWFYALLGCLALAGLICLGFTALGFGVFKFGRSITQGAADPTVRRENAIKQLGAVPEGYQVALSVSVMGFTEMTYLTTRAPLEDGGFGEAGPGDRIFGYLKLPTNESSAQAKASFADPKVAVDDFSEQLARAGVNVRLTEELKRGALELEGRTLRWVAGRGVSAGPAGGGTALVTLVLFDCASDAMQVGMWQQGDAHPELPGSELELAGTIADEAELSRFLRQIDPCRK